MKDYNKFVKANSCFETNELVELAIVDNELFCKVKKGMSTQTYKWVKDLWVKEPYGMDSTNTDDKFIIMYPSYSNE
jgi:hypothetical protein